MKQLIGHAQDVIVYKIIPYMIILIKTLTQAFKRKKIRKNLKEG